MSTLLYTLVLFGCTDDAALCEPLLKDPPSFESRVACELAADKAIVSDIALMSDHPMVEARCFQQGTTFASSKKDAPKLARSSEAQPRPR